MTGETADRLTAFLTVNEDSLFAARVAIDNLSDRPYNIRCKSADETYFLFVRWKTNEDQLNVDILHELCELLSHVNAFNYRHQLSDINKVIVIR